MNYKINNTLLRTRMKEKGLKTIHLAEQSTNDWAQVKRILSGETQRPRIDTVARICDVLEITDLREVLVHI